MVYPLAPFEPKPLTVLFNVASLRSAEIEITVRINRMLLLADALAEKPLRDAVVDWG